MNHLVHGEVSQSTLTMEWNTEKSDRILLFSQKRIWNNSNFKTALKWCLNIGNKTYPLQLK